jgi:hypothetical protein
MALHLASWDWFSESEKPGLAHASQASAAMSPMEFATRRISSVEAILACSMTHFYG